ncbi:hypothetical protein LZ016_07645 [Sphingomonas sp. SM33]|uniref:Uncharacterized protein n=1 Tax=Sphingomonas telluris TaxID=2907998 RepID=A0ABS9VLY2_9SPHN|nr:hypothetical protein [Sphingomonas telluris]MCH8615971.1 hypothetical protein [Sphingomonas telluris]
MVEAHTTTRSKDRETYLLRAEAARAEAAEATLANVRERCLRAEAAWMEMAARAERTETMRAQRESEKAHQESVV